MNGGEEQTVVHYQRLCTLWKEAIPTYLEYHGKSEEELLSWAEACRRKGAMAEGRLSGDGFWEARAQWYREREQYLRQYAATPSFVQKDRLGNRVEMKRKISAIRPMDPYAKRRLTESGEPSSEMTYSVDPLPTSPTPSGSPSGEKEVSTSTPSSPSQFQSGLDLIKVSYE